MDDLLQYVQELQSTLQQLQMRKIESVISVLQQARERGQTVFIMGNGGSASTAAHFVCDLAKNTRGSNRPLFRVVGLADNMPIFSAYANDEGYDQVFVQQLASLVRPRDVVIGISASGNSANVLRAIELAKEHGATTIGFTGFDGGQLGSLVDLQLHVPSDVIEQVEDIHLVLEHMICSRLRDTEEYEVVHFETGRKPGDADKAWNSLPAKEIRSSVSPPIRWDLSEAARDLDIGKILPRIMILAMESVGAESGTVVLVDEEGRLATSVTAYQGEVLNPASDKLMDTLENGLAGWVVKNRRAVLINDTLDDPRWLRRPWDCEDCPTRSAISVPMEYNDHVVGVITLSYPNANHFSMEDMAILTTLLTGLSMLTFYSMGQENEVRGADVGEVG